MGRKRTAISISKNLNPYEAARRGDRGSADLARHLLRQLVLARGELFAQGLWIEFAPQLREHFVLFFAGVVRDVLAQHSTQTLAS